MRSTDEKRVPYGERLAWTPPVAAEVYSIDAQTLYRAIHDGEVPTFRPPNRDGIPGKRRVTRKAMDAWVDRLENESGMAAVDMLLRVTLAVMGLMLACACATCVSAQLAANGWIELLDAVGAFASGIAAIIAFGAAFTKDEGGDE